MQSLTPAARQAEITRVTAAVASAQAAYDIECAAIGELARAEGLSGGEFLRLTDVAWDRHFGALLNGEAS
jgi:hypothetical protein